MLKTPPLSLYIHFPWCLKKCPYCDFNSHTLRSELPEQQYIEALISDLDVDLENLANHSHRSLVSLFMGGGTPSLFSANALRYLLQEIKKRLPFSKDMEITLEANPGAIDNSLFSGYREAGINRLSLGIQSFQTAQLKRLGRIHNAQQAMMAIEAAKKAGFQNFNLDLMHGLPQQSIDEGLADIKQAVKMNPTHISWYQLTLEPNTTFAACPPELPQEDEIFELQELGKDYLFKKGYLQYEISAYSKEGKNCQHNKNYWEFGDYLGIGAGAHSKLTNENEQTIIRRWKKKQPASYLNSSNSFLADEKLIFSQELPFEFMLNALRLYYPIHKQLFEERTGLEWKQLEKPLNEALQLDLLTLNQNALSLTARGKRFYNDVVSLFLV